MGWVCHSWEGEEELWKLVWVYGALFIFLGHVVCIALRLFTDINIDSPSGTAGRCLTLLEVAYSIWMLISLWRCAFNVIWKGWAYLARFSVIVYMLLFCSLCYVEKTVAMPEEMITRIQDLLQEQTSEWLNGNAEDDKAKSVKKKKPSFMIKVNRI